MKKNSCSPKLLATTEKTGEVFQFAILALSWSGIPRTPLLQLGHTACGMEPNEETILRATTGDLLLQLGHTACGIERRDELRTAQADALLQLGHTACGIETLSVNACARQFSFVVATGPYRLRY